VIPHASADLAVYAGEAATIGFRRAPADGDRAIAEMAAAGVEIR